MRISYLSSDVCSSDLFAITRHPMMWGLALWALAHALVMPTPAQIILSATIAVLALVGSAGQDAKKARLMGDAWRHWAARTSFVPFARQFGRITPWGDTIRSEEHTSELQSLMRISYAVFCLTKKTNKETQKK